MTKRILVLGATGAMGKYLVPRLAEMGFEVDAYSLDDAESNYPNVHYYKANVKELDVFREICARHYDGMVDFMIYSTPELIQFLPVAMANTGHYIYLSSYRAYSGKEVPVKETSPKFCDILDDRELHDSEDYSVYKGRGEHLVRSLPYMNWTIVRPAITYSLMRYQLVTLEAANTVGRAFAGKMVVLPAEAFAVQATMSWAGNVAEMIARLLFNEKAICEDFSVCTAEHRTWGEIAEYYREICGLKSIWVSAEDYLDCIAPKDAAWRKGARWQLIYDRLLPRIMDNSKVLAATGLRQEDMMPLCKGLEHEISRCPKDFPFPPNPLMDEYIARIQ